MSDGSVNVKRSNTANSYVVFGKTIVADKDSEFQLFTHREGEDPVRVKREYINGRGKVNLGALEPGNYIVAVFGDKTAGVGTSHGVTLNPPFKIKIDAPEDHSKDYMKISVPATNTKLSLSRAISEIIH